MEKIYPNKPYIMTNQNSYSCPLKTSFSAENKDSYDKVNKNDNYKKHIALSVSGLLAIGGLIWAKRKGVFVKILDFIGDIASLF